MSKIFQFPIFRSMDFEQYFNFESGEKIPINSYFESIAENISIALQKNLTGEILTT